MLMEGLAVAIQQNEISISKDGVIVSELESFVYEHTPAGPTPRAAQLNLQMVCTWSCRFTPWGFSHSKRRSREVGTIGHP